MEIASTYLRFVRRSPIDIPNDPELYDLFASLDADAIRLVLLDLHHETWTGWKMPEPVMVLILQKCGRVLSKRELDHAFRLFGYMTDMDWTLGNQAVARALVESKNPWAHHYVEGIQRPESARLVEEHIKSKSGLSSPLKDQLVHGSMHVDSFRMFEEDSFGDMPLKKYYHCARVLGAVFERFGRVLSRDEVDDILDRSMFFDKAKGTITNPDVEAALIQSCNPFAFCFCASLNKNLHCVIRNVKSELRRLRWVNRGVLLNPEQACVIAKTFPPAIWAFQDAYAIFYRYRDNVHLAELRAMWSRMPYTSIASEALAELLLHWTSKPGLIQEPRFCEANQLMGVKAARWFVEFTQKHVTRQMVEGLFHHLSAKFGDIIAPKNDYPRLRAALFSALFTVPTLRKTVTPLGSWRVQLPLSLLHRAMQITISSYK